MINCILGAKTMEGGANPSQQQQTLDTQTPTIILEDTTQDETSPLILKASDDSYSTNQSDLAQIKGKNGNGR